MAARVTEGKAMLRKRWDDLRTPPAGLAHPALARWKRERGYALERLIVDLARMEGVEAEYGYTLAGEQVDGYFALDHRHFLLEAKWHEVPIATSEVFSFQGKLRGKLLGTLGFFVSAGTFAADTSSALVHGKDIDVLLADRDDIEFVLEDGRSFAEMVRAKMRVAAQKGDVYFRYRRWLDVHR